MNVQTISYFDKDFAKKITQSFRDTGFAVISESYVPKDAIFDAHQEWKDFFSRDDKEKQLFNSEGQNGFFPMGSENAKGSSIKDLKEFYQIFGNVNFPQEFPKSRRLAYLLEEVGKEVLLGLEENTPLDTMNAYEWPTMIEKSVGTMFRAIHYPPLEGSENVKAVRAAAHEDINFITLLPAASEPGLQVRDRKGNWHDVSCDHGNVVINVGDMLEKLTNGYYKSTSHRVVNPESGKNISRISMPLFLHPHRDVRLSTDYTAGEYLNERLKEIGLL